MATPIRIIESRVSFFLITLFLIGVSSADGSGDTVLWYNGDMIANPELHYGSGTGNGISTNFGSIVIYDDFVITDPAGWLIERVWTNNVMRPNPSSVTEASWSIRTNMSAGNGGTVIAGGVDAVTLTPTGRVNDELRERAEHSVEVSGLNIVLDPGRYWLSVSPLLGLVRSGQYDSIVSWTFKEGSIGAPYAENGNSFLDAPQFGRNFAPAVFPNVDSVDYSMGVGGKVLSTVPEPTSMLLVAAVFVRIMVRRKRS